MSIFNYSELILKERFFRLPREQLEEELSVITHIIEEIPTAEQYDNIYANRNKILEIMSNRRTDVGEAPAEYYLVVDMRYELGMQLFGPGTASQMQRLMITKATEDRGTKEFSKDNWHDETSSHIFDVLKLSEYKP